MADQTRRPPIPVQVGAQLHVPDSKPAGTDPTDPVPLLCGRRPARALVQPRKRWTASGWCDRCFLLWLNTLRPATTGRREIRRAYEALGWPVTLRGQNVSISLRACSVVALTMPTPLATAAADVLNHHPGPRPALVHDPRQDQVRTLLLRAHLTPPHWPSVVQRRAQGTLLLPPSMTPHGPITWHTPPWPHHQGLCPETRVGAALIHCGALPHPNATQPHAEAVL